MFSRTASILSAVAISALVMGCSVTQGSGVHADEKRQVTTFQELEIHNVDARIVVDPTAAGDQIEVSGDDNLVRLVNTHVNGNRLVVDVGDTDIDPALQLVVVFRTPHMTRIEADRRARVDITLTVKEALTIEANSSARITARGAVDRLEATLTGSAVLEASDLVARDVELDAAGSSTAHVCATGTLDVDLAGSSDASYTCDPDHIERDVAPSSHLDRR